MRVAAQEIPLFPENVRSKNRQIFLRKFGGFSWQGCPIWIQPQIIPSLLFFTVFIWSIFALTMPGAIVAPGVITFV